MRTIYLDLCCLNRPFDDQHQPRVRLEAEAVLGLVQLAKRDELRLIGSEVWTSNAAELRMRIDVEKSKYSWALPPRKS